VAVSANTTTKTDSSELAMVVIEPITATNAAAFRTVRLLALQNSPGAFSGTYARESVLTDAEWNQRIETWNGDCGIGYLAAEDGAWCGIAGALLDAQDTSTAQLLSMWVAPGHRRSGVGKALVDAIEAWARSRAVQTLRLMVTSHNPAAIDFYTRIGFTMTGRTGPYPNDRAVFEYEMAKRLE
jgi:ribosomal protein S18 acetylase RimI-like enzyme